MRKKYASCILIIFFFGCKHASFLSDYGIEKNDIYFSIAVLPDTQYYTALKYGGTMQMFENQINWILKNQKKEKITYVIHLGDITDHNASIEWERAKSQIEKLHNNDIPYGLAVGNHDETPNGRASKGSDTTQYTMHFGKNYFKNKSWYGNAMGSNNNNDNHFDLFDSNGDKYMVMYFVFNDPDSKGYNASYEIEVMHWADSVLSAYPDRKAILVCHSMLGLPKGSESNEKPGTNDKDIAPHFTKQGNAIYNMAKEHSNVFLMLGGHISGEGFRRDSYNGNVIKTYLADYQGRESPPYSGAKDRNGGNGLMRLMRFNITKQTLSVISFAPQTNGSVIPENDNDSKFTEPLYQ